MSKYLTSKQIEVLKAIFEGKTNKGIGNTLNISQFTVKNHIQHLLRKLQVRNRIQAIRRGLSLGILDVPGEEKTDRPVLEIPIGTATKEEAQVWFTWKDLKMCPETRELTVKGVEVKLTPRQFLLLKYFLERPKTIHSRETIMDSVWTDTDVDVRTVDTALNHLKGALRTHGYANIIVSVRDVGYRLNPEYRTD